MMNALPSVACRSQVKDQLINDKKGSGKSDILCDTRSDIHVSIQVL